MPTYRLYLKGYSNNELFRIKLLERPLRTGTKIFVEIFFLDAVSYMTDTTYDNVICIRSGIVGNNDFDTRVDGSSHILGKVFHKANSYVQYNDPCLCDLASGREIFNLNCLHSTIDVQITYESGLMVGLQNTPLWSLDLLIIEGNEE